MTLEVKTDLILKMLYEWVEENNGIGMIYPKLLFDGNNFPITDEEVDYIIALLESKGYINSQINGKKGKRISFDSFNRGKEFVESDSFSQSGTSILKL